MQDVWDRFHKWLTANAPQVLESLPPGASDEEIRLTEETLGVTLPDDFKASYRIHNGQGKHDFIGIFHELLSLGQVRKEWLFYKEEFEGESGIEGIMYDHSGPVRDDVWNVRWIPFSTDHGGQHHCIDFDPGETGQAGQIIYHQHDTDYSPVKAANFRSWLTNIVDECEAGQRVYSPEYGVIEVDFL